jgi:DNA repair protein RadA/Sms
MPKTHSQYVCQECGRTTIQAMGRCPSCGAWDSMVEEIISSGLEETKGRSYTPPQSKPIRLSEIEGENQDRWPLGMAEFARVLGGGMVPGSIVLLGGDPGIGKSTLMLQVAVELAAEKTVLYVSGEESARQIKMRAERLHNGKTTHPEHLYLVTETNLDAILAHVDQVKPMLLVVDSIQTVFMDGLSSSAGSVSQVRECA